MIFDATDTKGTYTEPLNIVPTNKIKDLVNKSVIDHESNIVYIDVQFKLVEIFERDDEEIAIFNLDKNIAGWDERISLKLNLKVENLSTNIQPLVAVIHRDVKYAEWHLYLQHATSGSYEYLDKVISIKDSFVIDKNYNNIDTNIGLLNRYRDLIVYGKTSASLNLFNLNDVRPEVNLDPHSGYGYDASGFTSSTYIEVEPNTQYIMRTEYGMAGSTSAAICWYDYNGNFISGSYLNGTYYNSDLMSPAGARKCRISMLNSEVSKMQFMRLIDYIDNNYNDVKWVPSLPQLNSEVTQLKTSLNDVVDSVSAIAKSVKTVTSASNVLNINKLQLVIGYQTDGTTFAFINKGGNHTISGYFSNANQLGNIYVNNVGSHNISNVAFSIIYTLE